MLIAHDKLFLVTQRSNRPNGSFIMKIERSLRSAFHCQIVGLAQFDKTSDHVIA